MALLTHKCPHCLTEHIALRLVDISHMEGWNCAAYFVCPKCVMPSCAHLTAEGKQGATQPSSLKQFNGDLTTSGWRVKAFWPAAPGPLIPELLPPDVERIYLQAERNFPVAGNEEASGTMYRKALDIGLKKIDPAQSGMLGPRIKALTAAGKLTGDIAVWSDTIRDVGNEAAHEETPITRGELVALRSFSEMVLRYLFSLPGAVKKRRGEKLDWETSP